MKPGSGQRPEPDDGSPEQADLAEQLRGVSGQVAEHMLDPSPNTLLALAQAAELVDLAGRSQRAVIGAARARGVSWTTIGGVLGITRQAAYQRFGQGATKSLPPENVEYAGAAAVSEQVLAELRSGDWDGVLARGSAVIRSDLGADGLRDAWQLSIEGGDDVLAVESTRVRRVGAVTIAETPMRVANGELLMRLTFNSDGLIVGIWFDPPANRVIRD